MARQRGHSVAKEVSARQLGRKEWEDLLEQWLLNERDRYIIKRHVLDGVTYEKLNTELEGMGYYPLSDRALCKVISKGMDILSRHIE